MKPWYRERWPWLLAAGPLLVVVGGCITAWLAWSTNDGIVADDYYRRGILINKDLERATRAEALRLGAMVDVDGSGRVGVKLSGRDGAAAPASLRVVFTNATRAGLDRSVLLSRDESGAYTGRIDVPPPGRWLIGVETETWRLPAVETGAPIGSVRLGTARAD